MRVAVLGRSRRISRVPALRRYLTGAPSLAVMAGLLAAAGSHAAVAAPVDAATAQRLALEVLSLGPATANPKMKTTYGPDVKVEASGDGQLVTVPSPTYTFGKDGEDKIAFDKLAVIVGPSSDSNGHPRYPITYQSPSPPTITEAGKPTVKIAFGKFDMSGIYAPDLTSFLGFKGSMADLVFNDPSSTDNTVKVATLSIDQNATEESGTVSGQNIASAKGFTVTTADGTVKIGELRETVTGTKVAVAPWIDGFRRISALMPQNPPDKPDPAAMNIQIKAALDIVEKLPPLADNIAGQLTMSDLNVAMKDSPPFALSSMAFGLSFARPSAGLGDAGIDIAVLGIKVPKEAVAGFAPPDTAPALLDMIPNGLHLTIGVKGAPTQEIVAELVKAGRTYTDTTDQTAMDSGLQAVNAALGKAHSQLAFGLDLASPAVKIVVNTALVVDTQSAFGVNGSGKVTVTGLDQEMTKLRGATDSTSQQASAVMTMLKGMGTPRPAGNDIVYDYTILVSQDGKFTVNGQDLGALMGMGGGGPPPDAPAPAPVPKGDAGANPWKPK